MAETQLHPPAPVPPAPCGAIPVEMTRVNSPANSETTERTVIAPERRRTMEFQPYSRAAAFSTDLGRRPAREPLGPPFAPVIVRSEQIMGVVSYAGYWRSKHPKIYHSFFPESGWTITDLWDNADIHLESPGFLEEVLGFICRDNTYRANEYMYTWSRAHPEKLDTIGGDMSQIYDISNPPAIVDKIFTDGETDQYPHVFLWHVFHSMRICMSTTMKKQAGKAKADTQGVVKEGGEAAGSTKPGPSFATENPAMAVQVKQSYSASSLGLGPRKPSYADSHLQTSQLTERTDPPQQASTPYLSPCMVVPMAYAQSGFSGPSPRGPSFGSSHPGRVYYNQATGYPAGQHAAAIPSSYANGQLRNPKNRPARSDSNAYGIQSQTRGLSDNFALSLEQQVSQASGPMLPGSSSRFVPSIPMGPGMVPPHPIPQFPPNGAIPSPQVHATKARYPSTMQQHMIPAHATPYMAHPMDAFSSQFGHSGAEQRGMPFSDMTNNMQYPPSRRPSYVNKSSKLYDPYGTERPDKAGFTHIPTKTNFGKTRHSSFSNNNGRSRKFSTSFGSQPFDRDGSTRPNAYHGDLSQIRAPYMHVEQNTVDDMDQGCSLRRIGPNNNKVFELHVKNIPKDVKMDELGSFFHQHSKVTPTQFVLRSTNSGGDQFGQGFVHFSSTADARQGLRADGKFLRGRALVVTVPNRYWKSHDVPMMTMGGHIAYSHARGGNRTSSYGPRSPTEGKVAPHIAVQYSPQDARSDLRRISHQQHDYSTTRGSLEGRKRETNTLSSTKDALKIEQQLAIDEVKNAAEKSDSVFAKSVPVESSSGMQPDPASPVDVVSHTEPQSSAVNLAPIIFLEEDVIPKQPVIVSSNTEVSTEDTGTEVPKMEILQEASLENTPSEAITTAQLIPFGHSSPAKRPSTIFVLPPEVESPSNAEQKTPASQNTFDEIEHETKTHPQDATIAARSQDDTASEDDQKNDSSFHSAQESQSDAGKNERKGEAVRSAEVDRGPPASVTSETTSSVPQLAESEPASQTFGTIEPDAETCGQPESKVLITAVEKPSSEAAKKPGAKQTQSLFPFAKPSKSQTKRERQAKKKDKRKDKDRGKTEQVVATTTTVTEITVGISRLPATNHTSKQEVRSGLATTVEAMKKPEASPGDNIGTDVAIGTDTTPGDASPCSVRDRQVKGKQEARKLEIQHATSAQKALQTKFGDDSLETRVLYHSEIPSPASLPQSAPVEVEEQQFKGEDRHIRRAKQIPHMIAVPKLGDLLKIRHSQASKTLTLDTTSSKCSPTETLKDALVAHGTGDGKFAPFSTHQTPLTPADTFDVLHMSVDQASIGSSPTLRAESPPPISPSPTMSSFHTPAQTPSDINPPPRVIAPPSSELCKKKKKNKKKNKKTASNTIGSANNALTGKADVKEPFADQLSEIEGIKSANTTGSYYLRSAQGSAQKESRTEDKVRPALVSSMV
jgi:hypothetical protein